MAKQLNVDMRFTADTSQAKQSIAELQKLLSQAISQPSVGVGGAGISAEINKAKIAATELKVKLQDAMRTDGSLDLVKFNNSLKASGQTLSQYGIALSRLGPSGKQAFLGLTQSISSANIQFQASNSLVNQLWVTLKNVARFQISSSAIHAFIGGIQSAYGYAQDLNESLNNIRIVTGQTVDQMARFTQQANKTARQLSATTLDYTNASLIYYQQGLNDSEVAERTEATLKLANVSRQSAEAVSDQMTAIWNNFADGSKSLEYYIDVITALGASTASSSQEIAGGMEKFASVAKTVGLSYEYAASALATIVAQTRQSEDTVGTGLRTIFARLDSLKLGETLEDGVGLTKYTQALKTIGVDVLDVNGNLKDMDSILSGIGERWSFLTDTQKTAVAQTVGGVRQYANLMALFDNWDKFQQNLSTAQNSSGALQEQADIYAQSWEASRDRVKAAAEAIHNALIDENFFIKLNKFFENNLDGLSNLIKALGGLPGVLATVGVAFTAAFGPQLSQGLDNLIERIKFISGKTQANIINEKKSANETLANMYADSQVTSGKYADIAYKSQAEFSNTVLTTQLSLRKQLSNEEQNIISALQEQHSLYVNNAVAAGEELQKTEQQVNIQEAKINYNANKLTEGVFNLDKINFSNLNLPSNVISDLEKIKDLFSSGKTASEEFTNALNNIKTATLPDFKELNNLIQTGGQISAVTNALSKFGEIKDIDNLKTLDNQLKSIENTFTSLGGSVSNNLGKNIADLFQKIHNAAAEGNIEEVNMQFKELQTALDTLSNSNNTKIENLENQLEQLETVFKALGKTDAVRAIQELRKELDNLAGDSQHAPEAILQVSNSLQNLKTYAASVKGEITSLGQALTGLASSLMAISSIANSIKGLKDIWGNEDTSFTDKMLSSASSIGIMIFSLSRLKDGLGKVKDGLKNAKIFETFSNGAIAAANSLSGFGGAAGTAGAAAAEAGTAITTFGGALAVLVPIIVAVVGVIALLTYGIYELYRAYNADAIAAQNAAEAAEALGKKSQETAQKAEQIKQAFSGYDSAIETLQSCTKGTDEWYSALEKVNNEILSILEKYPELAKEMELAYDENGMLTVANRDEIINKAESQANNAKYASILANNVAAEKSLEAEKTNIRRQFTASTATAITDEDVHKISSQNAERYTVINNAKEASQWTPKQWEEFAQKAGLAGDELSSFQSAIEKLANSTDQVANQIKNSAQLIAESKLGDKYNAAVKGLVSSGFKSDYDTIYEDVLEQSDKYNKTNKISDLNTDENSIWRRYLSAIGEDFNTTFYKLQPNAIQGEDDNRTYHFIDAEGKAQSIRAEEMAAAIAAAEALDKLTGSADAAAKTLKELRTGENKNIASALEGFFANGNFSTATQSQLKNIKAGIAQNNGDISSYLSNLGFSQDLIDKIDTTKFSSGLNNAGIEQVRRNAFGDKYENARERSFGTDYFEKFTTPISKAFEKITTLQGFNDLSDADYNSIISSIKTIYGQQGSIGLTKFIDNLALLNLSSEDAATVADALANTNWSSAESIANLQSVIAQIAGPSNAASEALLALIEAIKQAAGEATTLEEAQTRHAVVEAIDQKIKQYGDTIPEEEYKALAGIADTHNVDLSEWFKQDSMTGDYAMTGNFDMDAFHEMMENLSYSGFEDLLASNQENMMNIGNLVETQKKFDDENYLSTLQNKEGNDLTSENQQDQLTLLEALGYGKNDETQAAQLKEWKEALSSEEGAFSSEQQEAVNEAVQQLTESYSNLSEIQLELAENQDRIMADEARAQILSQADALGISREELTKYAKALQESGQAESNLMALLKAKEHFEEAQGIEEAAEAYEDYEQAVKGAYKGTAKESQAFDKMTKAVAKMTHNALSPASKEFLKTSKGMELVRNAAKKIPGAVQALDNALGKIDLMDRMGLSDNAISQIMAGTKTLQEAMAEERDNITSGFENLGEDIQTIWDELPQLDPGQLIQGGSLEAACNNMVATLAAAGQSTEQIIEAMSEEGIDAVPKDSKTITTTIQGQGSYENIFSYMPWNVDTVLHVPAGSVPDTTDVTITEQVQGWEFRKKGEAPSPEPAGGGGGGGGGGGSKPKAPKAHKKSDMGKRYHRVKEQIEDTNRQKDEAERRKDRAFGAEKLDQLEKEIKLRKENIKLQQDYIDQINGFLKGDRKDLIAAADKLGNFVGMDLTPIFDDKGLITNYQEIEDKLLSIENYIIDVENSFDTIGAEMPDGLRIRLDLMQQYVDDMRDYEDRYEETLNLLEEQINETSQQVDELSDALFEITTTKVELKIGLNDDEASRLEYFLTKYEDNAYKAAEAISVFGDQAVNQLKRIGIYQEGINELLASKGLTLADLENLDSSAVQKLIEEGDFTQEQVDALREWRDGLLEANQAMMELRTNIAERVLDTFDQLNEKVENSYDLFDHYNSILENYKDITDLLGRQINQEQRKLIDDLNNAMLENQKNTTIAAKARYDDLVEERVRAQALYDTALAEGGEDAAQKYEEILQNIDEALNNAEEQYLEAWQETMNTAQTIFETMLDNIVKDFEDAMSGTFGSMDYLQEAFDRQGELDENYLDDYDKLYELNKLERELNKVLSDTRGVTNRKALLDLQAKINEYQENGVQLSQYDVDALRAKFELQQAYNDLMLARDAKSTVRLSRDNEGNWGYVYTANQDEVEEAEQTYEDKLHEYQKLNDEYIQTLQEKALEVQTTYRDTLREIMEDVTLTDEERDARVKELNDWLMAQQDFFAQQSQNVFDNQSETYDRMLKTYDVAVADLVDSWEETRLAMLTTIENMPDYMQNWQDASNEYLTSLTDALAQRMQVMDDILGIGETSVETFGDHVAGVIEKVGENSDKTVDQVTELAKILNQEFGQAIDEAIAWEEEYAQQMNAAIEANERMVKSVNDLIAALANIPSYNHLHDTLTDFLQLSKDYELGKISKAEFDEANKNLNLELEDFLGFDEGGYTGAWGSGGRLALLHEKENVFNQEDTANLLDAARLLRQIDMSAAYMATGFGNLSSPDIMGNDFVIQQEVHIEASFPDVTDSAEIEEAFNNLENKAAQYANRKNED